MVLENKKFTKNFIWNLFGTGLNSLNSFFFLITVTRINGEVLAGVFSIGFAIGLVLYTIGLYAGRISQVTNIDKTVTDKDYFFNRCFTCFIMMLLGLIIVKIRGYSGVKLEVVLLLCLFKCLEAFSDVFYGIMHKNDLLYKSGQSLTIKSLVRIFGVLDCGFFHRRFGAFYNNIKYC